MINSPPAVSRSAKSSAPAVPRVVFTDPQAAAVGATNDRFSGTTRLSQSSKRFLTLPADGQHLTGAYAHGPEAGEWLQQATLAIRAPRADRDPARHDPAVPDLLRNLRRGAQGAAGGDRGGPAASECWREMSRPRPRRVLGLTRLWKEEPW
jgi:hypothetical protein